MAAQRKLATDQDRYYGSLSITGTTDTTLIELLADRKRKVTPNSRITASAACTLTFVSEIDGVDVELQQIHFPAAGAYGLTNEDEIITGNGTTLRIQSTDTVDINFAIDVQNVNA